MCAFSQPVDVSDTLIFARIEGPRQYLVYKMVFSSDEDLAMILPIPVSTGSGEDAVSFISMEDHPDFFNMLSVLFPTLEEEDEAGNVSFEDPVAEEVLNVHQVGYFDASFVPNIQDFSRLDEGFRLPGHVLEQFPGGANYGFVVFKLSKGHTQEVHPMAFSFPTRMPDTLFFPTVHVHDGKFHETADFDHLLFCRHPCSVKGWEESAYPPREGWEGHFIYLEGDPLSEFITGEGNPSDALKTIHQDWFCYRQEIRGEHKNEDILIPLQ